MCIPKISSSNKINFFKFLRACNHVIFLKVCVTIEYLSSQSALLSWLHGNINISFQNVNLEFVKFTGPHNWMNNDLRSNILLFALSIKTAIFPAITKFEIEKIIKFSEQLQYIFTISLFLSKFSFFRIGLRKQQFFTWTITPFIAFNIHFEGKIFNNANVNNFNWQLKQKTAIYLLCYFVTKTDYYIFYFSAFNFTHTLLLNNYSPKRIQL